MPSKKVHFSDVYILHLVESSTAAKDARQSYCSWEKRDLIRFFHRVEDWLKQNKSKEEER